MRSIICTVCALALAAVAPGLPLRAAGACDALAAIALPHGSITLAQLVEAGTFKAPDQADTTAYRGLPRFCRVAARLTPTPDSDIHVEVWLPASNWNGKLQAVGNGAFSGAISYRAMATALARGYATTSTDTGHSGGSASFALGHPEKVIDFGWRAVHEMTGAAKQLVAAYYDSAPRFSYWNGCSAGGRQAMKEAQRFPSDFDGIIAGAPGLDWTGRAAQAIKVAKPLQENATARLSVDQLRLVHSAVLRACDALDGVTDGLLENPAQCSFDPVVLQCNGSDGAACLTSSQVDTVRSIYSSPPNPQTTRPIPGLARGSELGWTDLGWTASARATGLDQFRFLVFKDPAWTIQRFNFDSDIVRAEEADGGTINALDPNLRPFIARGGKLLQYHGWSDPQISPGSSTQYFSRVVETVGTDKLGDSYRLFMVPGMGHCGGGAGPNTFDTLTALEDWVERGKPPDRILASHSSNGVVDRTRPLCPYPQRAVYRGAGSVEDAASFACQAP
jgi:feruloyl esterase